MILKGSSLLELEKRRNDALASVIFGKAFIKRFEPVSSLLELENFS
jgi:hypothetical protein